MKLIIAFLICILVWTSCGSPVIEVGEYGVTPMPNYEEKRTGYFSLTGTTTIGVEDEGQALLIKRFLAPLLEQNGWTPSVTIGSKEEDINLFKVDTIATEGYMLNINEESITINASSNVGFFYALKSLKQLMPISFYASDINKIDRWLLPATKIIDQPAFSWRGFMLDVSRHFFTVEEVKQVLDIMADLKFNRFHWHLADDQGWRIEIKSFPKLTEIGAWRMDYNNIDESISDWWGRPVQKEGEIPTYGGYYTQDEIKEVIAYAKDRFIEIIPEIDMPGHAQATIASYPEIGCVNASPYVATGGVFKNNTYNPGKEETYEFAEKMLNEVMDLFPFNYIHIGGDECNKEQWKIDPFAQAKMKEENLDSEEELQSYFIKRIEKIINKRNRVLIGWDEILEGGLAPNAVVMSWRGEEGGITAAKAGHEVIMTPSKYCYIDLKQGHDDLEPNLGYSQLLLSTAYNYKVIPEDLDNDKKVLIKGIQANLWTESISDWGKLTYMVFPRIYAIAENAWTDHNNKNWDNFTSRLMKQMKILDMTNVRYAVSAFSPWIDHNGNGNQVLISLKTEVNDLDIYYTLDGSDPTLQDQKYEDPFFIGKSTQLKAASFTDGSPIGTVSTMFFPIHSAAEARVIDDNGNVFDKLSDLSYARLHPSDTNWVRFNDDALLTMFLDSIQQVKEVSFNALRYTISGIYPPSSVTVMGSIDGHTYKELGRTDMGTVGLQQGRNKVKCMVDFPAEKVSSVQIMINGHAQLPADHHRSKEKSKFRIDEITLK